MDWLLYILVFLLGYVTCKTFYFLSATRLSVNLIRITQLISLLIISRSLEHFIYARTTRLQTMLESNDTTHNITAFTLTFDQEVETFKRRSIRTITKYHSSHFSELLEFEDWKSGMEFLDKHKEIVFNFLTEE